MRLLDLFCGAGGAGKGYSLAGFEVIGVDIEPQPDYPFEFHQIDALDFDIDGFDLVHASPPCHAHTILRHATGKDYLDLIPATREKLRHVPHVIENVPGSPLINPTILCGSSFPELTVEVHYTKFGLRRHRHFETNWNLPAPAPCNHRLPTITVIGKSSQYAFDQGIRYTISKRKQAQIMGIDWVPSFRAKSISQAIPPAYTKYIGEVFTNL